MTVKLASAELEIIKKEAYDPCFHINPDAILNTCLIHNNNNLAVIGLCVGNGISVDLNSLLSKVGIEEYEEIEGVSVVNGTNASTHIYKVVVDSKAEPEKEMVPARAFGLRGKLMQDCWGRWHEHLNIVGYGNRKDGYKMAVLVNEVPFVTTLKTDDGITLDKLYI